MMVSHHHEFQDNHKHNCHVLQLQKTEILMLLDIFPERELAKYNLYWKDNLQDNLDFVKHLLPCLFLHHK